MEGLEESLVEVHSQPIVRCLGIVGGSYMVIDSWYACSLEEPGSASEKEVAEVSPPF